MAGQIRSSHVPWFAPYINRITRPLLAAGVRIGPDVLLTVRGRKSGLPHSTPMTLCEHLGKRGVISAFGETDWARNLRAAGKATIRRGRRSEEVTAVELGQPEAQTFIRDVIAPAARRTRTGEWIMRHIDKIDIDHPMEASKGRPVFELRPR